ncbi:hypothetical protein PINS_up022595 [Pythium insidiosum]|nr:hypothetical protein PINS_up022595 [Pythium insidiosum]
MAYGGYAEYVRVDANYAFKIPEALPSDVAAPLLCAGVTVYTPLKQYVKPGYRVGVVGIGGLGHLALQFIKALGGTPVAFSQSPNKEEQARALGAEDFVVMRDPRLLMRGRSLGACADCDGGCPQPAVRRLLERDPPGRYAHPRGVCRMTRSSSRRSA